MSKRAISSILLTVFLIMGVVFVLTYYHHDYQMKHQLKQVKAMILVPPATIPPFKLIGAKNQAFTRENLLGHWTLLYFGYSRCPDACPTIMGILNQVYENLEKQRQTLPEVVFISVDPKRDTPDHLQDYAAYFNPHFKGVTGSSEAIQSFTESLGIRYEILPSKNPQQPENYLIEHSTVILLVNPEAQIKAVFNPPHEVDQIVKDLIQLCL